MGLFLIIFLILSPVITIKNIITKHQNYVRIGVVDSGADMNHDLLKERIKGFKNFSKDSTIEDHFGHGTHVAGIIVQNTSENIELWIIKNVSDINNSPEVETFPILDIVNYAIENDIRILNFSQSFDFHPKNLIALEKARDNNILIVASATNNRNNLNLSWSSNLVEVPENLYLPCMASFLSNVICVGSASPIKILAIENSYGNYNIKSNSDYHESVSIWANGEEVYSSVINNEYDFMSGASMATPKISALIARQIHLNEGKALDWSSIKSKLETFSDEKLILVNEFNLGNIIESVNFFDDSKENDNIIIVGN